MKSGFQVGGVRAAARPALAGSPTLVGRLSAAARPLRHGSGRPGRSLPVRPWGASRGPGGLPGHLVGRRLQGASGRGPHGAGLVDMARWPCGTKAACGPVKLTGSQSVCAPGAVADVSEALGGHLGTPRPENRLGEAPTWPATPPWQPVDPGDPEPAVRHALIKILKRPMMTPLAQASSFAAAASFSRSSINRLHRISAMLRSCASTSPDGSSCKPPYFWSSEK